jgi:hypothetical protein
MRMTGSQTTAPNIPCAGGREMQFPARTIGQNAGVSRI